MIVDISRLLLADLLDRAAASPAEEVCGLLLGRAGRIDAAPAAANVAPNRARRFELDPAMLIAAHKAARNGGPQLLGHYHSHPTGMPWPSAHDAADAVPGMVWLILGGGEARLFEAVVRGPIHDRFRALELRILDAPLA